MRLNRFLARSGLASRRKAEEIILSGKVTVNGSVVNELATDIDPNVDSVEVGGEIIELPEYKYYLLNKPAGYTCTRSDAHANHTIFELLPKDNSLFSVGRLDRETTGLLIVTNDGNFAQNIIHPSGKIPKTYVAKLANNITKTDTENLVDGVRLEDGPARAIRAIIVSEKVIELTIEEGRKRIVRRMIESIGNKVVALERTKIGGLSVDIPQGKCRELTESEVELYA